jgi:cytochrome P450
MVQGNTRISRIPRERLIDFDISRDPELRSDLFKRLGDVRASAPPVAYSRESDGWLVFDESAIRKVMMDGTTFSSSHLSRRDGSGPGFIPLSIDPPNHAPLRHLLNKYFEPAQISALEPLVREWAEHLIGKLKGEKTCDFVKAVAGPMPVSIFMILMGLPLDRFDEFRSWVVHGLSASDSESEQAQADQARQNIRDTLDALIELRRRDPKADLISKLLAEQIDGRPISRPEMMSICYLLFLTSLDTVTNAMAFGMRHLARHPEMQYELRQDPGAISSAMERLLRLCTFVNTRRIAKREMELEGAEIEAGNLLWCALWSVSNSSGAGSHETQHMAFGVGPHLCPGAAPCQSGAPRYV